MKDEALTALRDRVRIFNSLMRGELSGEQVKSLLHEVKRLNEKVRFCRLCGRNESL